MNEDRKIDRPAPLGEEPLRASGRIKLVYIVGNPRSGSTVLGIVLGNHPNAFFTGELNQVPYPAWDPGRLCACKTAAKDCEFWSIVRRDLEGSFPLQDLRLGQIGYERWGRLAASLLTSRNNPGLRAHVTKMSRVAQSISRSSGKGIVIDSSKSPARGRLYQFARREGIDVFYLHVIRDGRAFLWSEGQLPGGKAEAPRKWRHFLPMMIGRWALVNVLSTLLCGGRRRRYLLVRYEDFVSDPERSLSRVGGFLGEDLSSVIRSVREHSPIPIGHVVGGSRLRFGAAVRLNADTSWAGKLTNGPLALYWLLAGWAAWAYGYHRGAPVASLAPSGKAESS